MADLLEPKEFKVSDQKSVERIYQLGKFPAVAGREIVCKYPLSGLPKLGDYAVNEETMFKLMGFVGVLVGGQIIPLTTRALIDNHVPDWETLARIEAAMMEYNCSFFLNGKVSTFLNDLAQKLPAKISEILTASLAALSQPAKPPSTNSEPSIP